MEGLGQLGFVRESDPPVPREWGLLGEFSFENRFVYLDLQKW
jgi:hypothetical protein